MKRELVKAGLAGAAAIALSVSAAQAELTERAMSNEQISNIVRQLQSVPAFGDVLPVAERLAGRGLSKAADLDESPLTEAGLMVGGGALGAGVGFLAGGEAVTAETRAALQALARQAGNNVVGGAVSAGPLAAAGLGRAINDDFRSWYLLGGLSGLASGYGLGGGQNVALGRAINDDFRPWYLLGGLSGLASGYELGAYPIPSYAEGTVGGLINQNTLGRGLETPQAKHCAVQEGGKCQYFGTLSTNPGEVMIIGGGDGCAIRKNGVCLDAQ